MVSNSKSSSASRSMEVYLEKTSEVVPVLMISTPVLKSSASRAPQHVRDHLHESSASWLYERFNNQSAADASLGSIPSTSSGDAVSAPIKQSRYLREADRCKIIRRIAEGEKQATLAREFGVTRAAICHIKKNRAEILARSMHKDARHPKRPRYQTISKPLIVQLDSQGDQSQLPIVYEVRSSPMVILMTALRKKETRPSDFRHFADRAVRLLLEEALSCAETSAIELVTPSQCVCEGVQLLRTSCGIALGEEAFPMLEAFQSIHPDSPTGFVDVTASRWSREKRAQLPPNLDRHPVFLMIPTCLSAVDVCAAVHTLLDMGAQESSIFFVCIVMSSFATSVICTRYPGVRIVTAAIDPDANGASISPGIGDFSSRYFAHNAFSMC